MSGTPATRAALVAGALLLASMLWALSIGALPLGLGEIVSAIGRALVGAPPNDAQSSAVLIAIRAPRVVLAVLVGAALGAGGASLQTLFRNPLADPGLLGVSSGAAAAAATAVVVEARLGALLPSSARPYVASIAGFAGALAATVLLVRLGRLARRHDATSALLLVGVALNALALAVTGFVTFVADDAQLRTIAFWNLGSFGAATWSLLAVVAPTIVGGLALVVHEAPRLALVALGEREARLAGVPLARTRRRVVVATALVVGASVAACGTIAFVGLMVPQIARLWLGPDLRRLLPATMLASGALLACTDTVARTVAAPAELPLGILTALAGAPLFLTALIRGRA
jgi:iron complex transport system permease protein